MKKLKQILQSKYLFKILCIMCLSYSVIVTFFIPINSKYNKNDTKIIGQVLQYQIDGNKLKMIIKGKEKIVAYYYFKTEKEKQELEKRIELGMILELNGEIKIPDGNTIPNGFNYKEYLKYQKINYYISSSSIKILKNNTSIFYYLKNKLIKRIDKIDDTGYLRTFILGDKTFLEEDIQKQYQKNGISHLFSISGMHVSLIVGLIMFLLNKISYNNLYKNAIVIPILLFYLFLTGIGASILRTAIMFIVFALNKTFNLQIKRLDLMLIVLIIAILVNPFIIYNMGFQFSYIISFTLIVFYKKITMRTKKWQQNLLISFICFLVSFPICIYNFSEVNLLSIILNVIMIPFISFIIFPMTLLTFIIPMIYPIYKILINCLEFTNNIISNIKFFQLILVKPSFLFIIIYYSLIYLSFWKRHYLYLFIIVIIFHKSYPYINNTLIFTVIDVGQGDSILVKLPNNKGNILIDTGGEIEIIEEEWKKSKKAYSITENKTVPYLKSLGINHLDYLIITHGDFDHMGEAINLVENFKVEKVIFNCGPYNDLERELIKVLDKKKIKYYSCIKELNIDNRKLYFLQTKEYDNENDNSNVIYIELDGYKFMFMGDSGIEKEKDILDKYNISNIDVLKVGHHGSKTSSSKKFIDEINPKYSIISVGKNNRYGHPNKEILNNLDTSKVYRTDQDGSIMFKVWNDKLKIETCAP